MGSDSSMLPKNILSLLLVSLFFLGILVFAGLHRSDRVLNIGRLKPAIDEGSTLGSRKFMPRSVPKVVDSTKPSSFQDEGIKVESSSIALPEDDIETSSPSEREKEATPGVTVFNAAVTTPSPDTSNEGNCDEEPDLPTYCKCIKELDDPQPDLDLFSMSTATVDGTTFKINTYRTNDIVSASIRNYGSWELETSRMFIKGMDEHYARLKASNPNIQKKDVKFLDIGANIGWYSVLIAAKGYGVISVEPMLTNLRGFKNSLCENNLQDRVEIHETALSEDPKVCKLFSITSNVGDGTIACEADWTSSDPAHPTYVFRQNVTFSRLDDLISDSKSIGLAKMDVEGYEAHVVGGGQQTLLNGGIPKIMSEWGPWLMRDAKSDPIEYLVTFQRAGYIVRRDSFDTGRILTTRQELDHLDSETQIGAVYIEKNSNING